MQEKRRDKDCVLSGSNESAIWEIVPRTETDWNSFLGWLGMTVSRLEVLPSERWLQDLESGYGASNNEDIQAVRGIFGQQVPELFDAEKNQSFLEADNIVVSPMNCRKITLGGPEVDELAVAKWIRHWNLDKKGS